MGGGLFGSKPKGPSPQELQRQKNEEARLERERRQAEREAERDRQQRLSDTQARSRRNAGRRSLISGSELGSTDQLG